MLYILVGAPAAAWLGIVVLMWALQEALLFPAPAIERSDLDAQARQQNATTHTVATADGVPLFVAHHAAEGKRAVIYFHGNGSSPLFQPMLAHQLTRDGWDFVSFAYRGYPGSGGEPGEAGMREDARAVWAFTTETLGIPPEHVVLYGKSLGGGVAIGLATEHPPAALVIESSFRSIRQLASEIHWYLPVGALLRHPFDSVSRASQVTCPVLILHGQDDTLIPVHHGRGLHQAFAGSRYVEVQPGGHQERIVLAYPEARAAFREVLDGAR